MDAIDLEKFNDGVRLAQAGKKGEAYQRFKALLINNPNDANLLLWVAYTSPDPVEAKNSIRKAIRVEPSNPNLQAAKDWFNRTYPAQKNDGDQKFTPPPPPPPDFNKSGNSDYFYQPPIYGQPQSFNVNNPQPVSLNQQFIDPKSIMSSSAVFGLWCVYFVLFILITFVVAFLAYYFGPDEKIIQYPYYYYQKTGELVTPALGCLVILTSIFGILDAVKRRSKFGPFLNESGLAVFACCILFWVILLPFYFARRHRSVKFYRS